MPGRAAPRRASPEEPDLPPSLTDATPASLAAGDEWQESRIAGIDLSGVAARGVRITECELVGVVATAAQLDLLSMKDVLLADCELSGAGLGKASLRRIELRNCRVAGLVLSDAQLRDVRFVACKLDGANFRFAQITQVVFEGCSLVDADFGGATFDAVTFGHCDLRDSDFSQASAESTRLHGSVVDGLRGASGLGGVTIDTMQVMPLALGVFAELGITIDDAEG